MLAWPFMPCHRWWLISSNALQRCLTYLDNSPTLRSRVTFLELTRCITDCPPSFGDTNTRFASQLCIRNRSPSSDLPSEYLGTVVAISPHEHLRKIGSYIGNRTLARQMAGRETRITEVRDRNADFTYNVLKRGCAISLHY